MLRGIVTIVAFIDVVKNDKFQQIVVMSILLKKKHEKLLQNLKMNLCVFYIYVFYIYGVQISVLIYE